MPSARVSTATAVNPGFFSNWRKANLTSFIRSNSEIRGPKPEGNSQARNGSGYLIARVAIRVSGFGFHSEFDLRKSGFVNHSSFVHGPLFDSALRTCII